MKKIIRNRRLFYEIQIEKESVMIKLINIKITLIIMMVCFLWFLPSAFSFTELPYGIPSASSPVNINGTDYYSVIQTVDYSGNEFAVYCPNNNGYYIGDTNNHLTGYVAPYYISFCNPGCITPNGLQKQYLYQNGAWVYNSSSIYIDHSQSLTSSTRTTDTVSINPSTNTWTSPSNFAAYGYSGVHIFASSSLLIPAGTGITPAPQLTINISPLEGGSVTIGNYTCDSSNSPCQYPVSEFSQMLPEATANTDYAFGGWIETENPHPLSLNGFSGSEEITTMFYKTFRNAALLVDGVRSYRKLNGNTSGGECLDYVEYETDLPDNPNVNDVCTYSAVNCLGQAAMKGYAVGNEPKEGAIVIYLQGGGGLGNGHAGIVTDPDIGNGNMSVHDSNWNGDGVVHDRTVSKSDSNIMGYIYPTP